MSDLLRWAAGLGPKDGAARRSGFAIRPGVVSSNIDLLKQGKVLVRVPDLGIEVWARLCAPGAGDNTGLFFAPNPDDEVLLAFDLNDPSSSYVLGGLWGTRAAPPVSETPLSETNTRVLRTGLTADLGHKIEFDDLEQSITITTSTDQKIVMDTESIELTTTEGTVSIKLDLTEQTVTINAPLGITLESDGDVKISGSTVSISGTVSTDIKGGMVTIN